MKSKPNYAWGLMAGTYLFSDSSYNVQSAMSGYTSAFGGYDIAGVVTVFGDAMFSFGDYTDFFAGLELSHSFYALANQLSITPAVYGMMGTQYYYDQHYTTRRIGGATGNGPGGGGGMGNGPGGSSGGGYTTTELVFNESSAFRLLAIELSLPINWQSGRFSVFLNPVYVLPQSPSSFTDNGIETKEVLSNSFYLSAGLTYKIGKE
jgi:hypothetical protein